MLGFSYFSELDQLVRLVRLYNSIAHNYPPVRVQNFIWFGFNQSVITFKIGKGSKPNVTNVSIWSMATNRTQTRCAPLTHPRKKETHTVRLSCLMYIIFSVITTSACKRRPYFILKYRPDMTLDVYRGRKTTKQQQQQKSYWNLYDIRFWPLPYLLIWLWFRPNQMDFLA